VVETSPLLAALRGSSLPRSSRVFTGSAAIKRTIADRAHSPSSYACSWFYGAHVAKHHGIAATRVPSSRSMLTLHEEA
jgi:hypothetical protein